MPAELVSTTEFHSELFSWYGRGPGPSKKQKIEDGCSLGKWSGPATYKRKHQKSRQEKWPFVAAVKDDPHIQSCSVLTTSTPCGPQGLRCVDPPCRLCPKVSFLKGKKSSLVVCGGLDIYYKIILVHN